MKSVGEKHFSIRLYRLYKRLSNIYRSKKKLHTNKNAKHILQTKIFLDKEFLTNFYKYIDLLSAEHLEMSYAGKWIIENRDTLLEEILALQNNVNKKLLNVLPSSDEGTNKNFPATYLLFKKYFQNDKSLLTEKKLIEFLQKYQVKKPLTLDEIFSLPLFLKLILINSICEMLWPVLQDTRARNDAIYYYLEKSVSNDIKKEFERIKKKGDEYAVFFFIHLKKRPYSGELVDLVRLGEDYLRQKKDEVLRLVTAIEGDSIGKTIRNLQVLKEIDWDLVFKNVSRVDEILSRDPVGIYPRLDTASRNSYLDVVKTISRNLAISEEGLSERVLELTSTGASEVERHVGYYIIDAGLKQLEGQKSWKQKKKVFNTVGANIYLVSILTIVFGFFALMLWYNSLSIIAGIVFSLLFILPIYGFVKRLINTFMTDLVAPRRLSKIDIKHDLVDESATMFVIPSLLINLNDIRRLVDSLEVMYLGNRGRNIFFCLLLDYKDSDREFEEKDTELFELIKEEIKKLNLKYRQSDKFSFYLRDRLWSDRQNRWMGWERKRGKILEFTNVLRENSVLSPYFYSAKKTPYVKYLVTVDEDAIVPKDFITDLVGTLSHPLNKAQFDKNTGKLNRGYVILQPRLNFTFKAKHQTLFSICLCDASGFDFYSRLLNELYFDLFAEGHYTGKGIIDIDGFTAQLNGLFQDDTILSHDLLEGAICGTGYISDIVIYEGFPASIKSFFLREHRWIRGNWQIADWLFSKIKNQQGNSILNSLTLFQKFKVLDNMLVSLLNPFLFILLILVWFGYPDERNLTYAIIIIEFFLLEFILGVYHILVRNINIHGVSIYHILIDLLFLLRNLTKKNLFYFLFLPYDVFLKADAIFKALYRKFISGKHTLQWSTFVASESGKNRVFTSYAKIFLPCWLFLLFLLSLSLTSGKYNFVLIALITIWLLVPIWVYIYDKPVKHEF